MSNPVKIGDTFLCKGDRKDIHTVVDILTTTNSKGEVVQIQAKAEHDFMGQKVTSIHPLATVTLGRTN